MYLLCIWECAIEYGVSCSCMSVSTCVTSVKVWARLDRGLDLISLKMNLLPRSHSWSQTYRWAAVPSTWPLLQERARCRRVKAKKVCEHRSKKFSKEEWHFQLGMGSKLYRLASESVVDVSVQRLPSKIWMTQTIVRLIWTQHFPPFGGWPTNLNELFGVIIPL